MAKTKRRLKKKKAHKQKMAAIKVQVPCAKSSELSTENVRNVIKKITKMGDVNMTKKSQ